MRLTAFLKSTSLFFGLFGKIILRFLKRFLWSYKRGSH